MRRFWSLALSLTWLVVGLAAGVALTYLSVIIPRSAELDRARIATPFIKRLDLKKLLDSADSTVTWRADASDESSARSLSGGPFSRYCILSASATLPAGQQSAMADAIKNVLESAATGSNIGLSLREGYMSNLQDNRSFLRTHRFAYLIDGHTGTIFVQFWGAGDTLRVFLAVAEH
jgi:hypothetical protein